MFAPFYRSKREDIEPFILLVDAAEKSIQTRAARSDF